MIGTLLVFADVVQRGGDWSIYGIAIAVIIICALIAIVAVIVKAMGYAIPQWVFVVIGILVAAFVGIVAIKFLASM